MRWHLNLTRSAVILAAVKFPAHFLTCLLGRHSTLALALLFAIAVYGEANPPRKVATVEGITEYQFDNGLRALLFPDQSHRLRVGDKVLLYSDGIDTARFDERPPGAESLLACAAKHRVLPVDEFVAALARDLFGQASPPDDLTLLGMEALAAP